MTNPMSLLLVLLLVPLVWSAFVQLTRRMFGQNPSIFDDRTEKTVMALMLLPIVVGLVFLLVVPMLAPLNRSHVFYPPVFEAVAEVAVQALPRPAPQGPDLTLVGVQTIAGLYFAGLAFSLWRLWQSHNGLARIVRSAQPIKDRSNVLCSELSSPAFAWGIQTLLYPPFCLNTCRAVNWIWCWPTNVPTKDAAIPSIS